MNKIFVIALMGFVAGILTRSFFNFGWSFALFFIFLGAIIGAIYYLLEFYRAVFFIGLFLFSVGLGVLRYNIKEIRSMVLEKDVGLEISFRASITDEPDEKENYARLVAEENKTKSKILLITGHYPEFRYGDEIEVFGELKKPEKYSESDFDWPAYLAKEDIYYEIFYPDIKLISTGGRSWLKRWLFNIKEGFIFNISAVVPEPNAGFLAGLTVGAKQAMPKELLEKFREVGIIHIVVLSGYNITIVADVVMKILSALPFYFGIGFGVLGIFLFALMTGASATVVRAAIMVGIVLLAKATGRIYHITIALAAAGFLMILHNPKILRFDASFQLSFLATIALIYVSPLVEKRITFVSKKFSALGGSALGGHLREIAAATISTQIFVLPFLLYKMGLLSIVGLPVNLLILIFVPVTMLFGFLAGILGFISQVASVPFGWAAYALTAYELWIADLFSKIPFASLNFTIPFWLTILIYIIYVSMILKLGKKYAMDKK